MEKTTVVTKRVLPTVAFYNDKGNPSPAVRAGLKEKAVAFLTRAVEKQGFEIKQGVDGALYIPLVLDNGGTVINARIELTATDKQHTDVPKPKATKGKETKTVVVIPDLD